MSTFEYAGGGTVLEGDIVSVAGKQAVVERVFSKGTRDARDFACLETGGLLLRFEDGDIQLWPWVNEDLEFRSRGEGHT